MNGWKKTLAGLFLVFSASFLASAAVAVGAVAGVALSFANRAKKGAAKAGHETTTLADLEK